MVKGRLFRTFYIVFTAAFVLACFLCLVLPLPSAVGGAGSDTYLCTWEDGRVTDESYLSAYESLVGANGNSIILERGNLHGEISMSEEARDAYATLAHGSLAELLSLSVDGLARIERAAMYRTFGNVLYCDGEYFRYTGEGVERCALFDAERVELLGALPKTLLKETGAKKLQIRAGAEFTPAALHSVTLEEITADKPYAVTNGAITLETTGGLRLVAGCPYMRSIAVPTVAFIDEGALMSCNSVEELSLPFLGERISSAGDLGRLFGLNGAGTYEIPATLKRVKVAGGKVSTTAFYRCDALEEIDLCGIAPQDIATNAFDYLPSLKTLHCAKTDILNDVFQVEQVDCGCYLYIRII